MSFLLNFFKLNSNLSTMFISLSTINSLKPAKPKLSNKKKVFLWINIKEAPPICSWFFFSVSVENCKWIICSSFFYYIVKVYVFCYWSRRTSIKFLFKSSFVSLSNNFSMSMLVIPFPQVIIRPRTLQEDYWTVCSSVWL